MAADTLIVRVRPGEMRMALVDAESRLKDFALYRGVAQGLVGDLFFGRVKKVIPAMEAAFIDIGAERDGFLGLPEARPQPFMGGEAPRDRISDYVREGEAVVVQVLAEARDGKGPKLTRRPSVAGAFCVLTPNDPGVRVSKRVANDAERNRLRAAVLGQLKNGEGCVVRSGAQGAADGVLAREVELLRARWRAIQDRAASAQPPAQLNGEDQPAIQFLSDIGFDGLSKAVVDDPAAAKALETELGKLGVALPGGVARHAGGGDVFAAFGVADEAAALLAPTVALPSGGSLIVEETAALTSIDVNAGGAAEGKGGRGSDLALFTNLEAVQEAARQMRLRNLCGLIVIDLMAMRGEEQTGRVVNALKEALARDPAGPFVLGTTRGGLLEVTRPRRRPPLSTQLLGPCPVCATGRAEAPLTVGLRALDRVLAEVWGNPALIPALRTPTPVVRALMAEAPGALSEMEAKLGQPLELIADDTLKPGQFKVEAAES